MKIYRVEHVESTYGPFVQPGSDLARRFQTILDTHPSPAMDGIKDFDDEDDRLGCHSLEQLKFWFQNHIPYLKELKMMVKIFECPDEFVKIGANQVAFFYNKANVVEELTLDCLQ